MISFRVIRLMGGLVRQLGEHRLPAGLQAAVERGGDPQQFFPSGDALLIRRLGEPVVNELPEPAFDSIQLRVNSQGKGGYLSNLLQQPGQKGTIIRFGIPPVHLYHPRDSDGPRLGCLVLVKVFREREVGCSAS